MVGLRGRYHCQRTIRHRRERAKMSRVRPRGGGPLQATKVAGRINRALDAAEELKRGYDDLVAADPGFADDWRLRSAQCDDHIRFLRQSLEWAERAGRGEMDR